ncbi:hypothetical protein ILUMI_19977 [Ignelater luminosus]|uniref:Ninjurin-1 n=1 Tax=Ignelater luminosus TaxID=2038154 RepID=A0A8K0CJD9_IGNLU|nr:hypothetical protein ILUMI_19977 [Ignelater luminosus]
MSASPIPARRANNLHGRSRSPSPAANPTVHHNAQTTTNSKNNLLSPDNSNLLRARRSTSPSESSITHENIPLIEAERIDPPLANPETDDLGDDIPVVNEPYPGIDDGFFFNRLNPDGPTVPDAKNNEDGKDVDSVDDIDAGRRGFPRGSRNPLSPSDNNRPFFPDLELGGGTDLESIPDVNIYQHKKTLAQGMMDLALFSANANQLRYVLESNQHPYYYSGIILISVSLILQVLIGVGLIWNSRYNVKDDKEICIANKINNFTIIGIFLVTVVNVFISAFGVASVQPVVAAAAVANAQSVPAVVNP